jgi:hypothetical protein
VDSKQLRELFDRAAHESDPAFLTLRNAGSHARFPGITFRVLNKLAVDYSDEVLPASI